MQCSKCNHAIKIGQEVCLNCGHILGYESEESKTCIHCNRPIPISYKKCPFCKKKQMSRKYKILFLLILIITSYFNYIIISNVKSHSYMELGEEYEKNCLNIRYEELVRRNDYYLESYITTKCKIIEVESVFFPLNVIKITAYVEENKDYKIELIYINTNKTGYLVEDEIEIYGKYKKLKGNTPVINAKIIK